MKEKRIYYRWSKNSSKDYGSILIYFSEDYDPDEYDFEEYENEEIEDDLKYLFITNHFYYEALLQAINDFFRTGSDGIGVSGDRSVLLEQLLDGGIMMHYAKIEEY